jgi:hypothetical protein
MSPPLWDEQVPGSRVAFLVGAGRSGTTLVYKLLCLHPSVAYISNYENRLPWFPDGLAARFAAQRTEDKLRAWFGVGGNAYYTNRPWLKKALPTPHEGEAVYAACGVPLHPAPGARADVRMACALRCRFESIRRGSGARLFVSKRTANNRRLPLLRSVFPAARYVHLVRDGREVAQSLSTVSWWDGHTIWWDGRTARQMESDGESRLAVCTRNWVREIEALQAGLAGVDPRQVLTLRFENLLREPLPQLQRVLGFLGLDCPASFRDAVARLRLGSGREAVAVERFEDPQHELAMHEARPLLRQLGYLR